MERGNLGFPQGRESYFKTITLKGGADYSLPSGTKWLLKCLDSSNVAYGIDSNCSLHTSVCYATGIYTYYVFFSGGAGAYYLYQDQNPSADTYVGDITYLPRTSNGIIQVQSGKYDNSPVSGLNNNFPLSSHSFVELLVPDSTCRFTGFSQEDTGGTGVGTQRGRQVTITNISNTDYFTITDRDWQSDVENQVACPGRKCLVVKPGYSVRLLYDAANTIWRATLLGTDNPETPNYGAWGSVITNADPSSMLWSSSIWGGFTMAYSGARLFDTSKSSWGEWEIL